MSTCAINVSSVIKLKININEETQKNECKYLSI